MPNAPASPAEPQLNLCYRMREPLDGNVSGTHIRAYCADFPIERREFSCFAANLQLQTHRRVGRFSDGGFWWQLTTTIPLLHRAMRMFSKASRNRVLRASID